MRSFQAVAVAQLALLWGVQSQEITARIILWSKEGCDKNIGDMSALTDDIGVFKSKVDAEDDDLTCMHGFWSNDDWPTAGDDGRKEAWIEQATIEDECKLLLYDMNNEDPENERACISNYIKVGSGPGCAKVTLPTEYGFSYCCGDGCGQDDVGDLFSKRDAPTVPPPVEEIFDNSKSGDEDSAFAVRDVTAPKRAAPLDLLEKRGDDDCKFVGNDDEPETRYLKQYRVSPISKCNREDGCEGEATLSYSESTSNSWGVESSLGATLFEVISASVSFSYTYEEAEENGFSYTYKYTVGSGAEGYIAYQPFVDCAKGRFEGDCKEWDSDVEGEACFLKMINGIPDGKFSAVIEYD